MADASGTFISAYVLAGFVALLGAVGALSLRPASTIQAVTASTASPKEPKVI
jgi:hypothetical protein